MEAGEYGLTRGTCFVARRLELVMVAGLLWLLGGFSAGRDFSCFFFSILIFLRAHTACCKFEAALLYFPLYW